MNEIKNTLNGQNECDSRLCVRLAGVILNLKCISMRNIFSLYLMIRSKSHRTWSTKRPMSLWRRRKSTSKTHQGIFLCRRRWGDGGTGVAQIEMSLSSINHQISQIKSIENSLNVIFMFTIDSSRFSELSLQKHTHTQTGTEIRRYRWSNKNASRIFFAHNQRKHYNIHVTFCVFVLVNCANVVHFN